MSSRRNEELREWIAETYGAEVLVADDHDNAILGIVARCGQEPFVVYDYDRVCSNYEEDGMSPDEAVEFLHFNFIGAWVGPHTPGVVEKVSCGG